MFLLQSQSITVDRQMRRYDVPRLAFINKCDRSGADPIRVLNQMRDKLKLNCSPVQLPLGIEDKLRGLIDVVEQRAYSFGGPFGNEITEVSSKSDCSPSLLCIPDTGRRVLYAHQLFAEHVRRSILTSKVLCLSL